MFRHPVDSACTTWKYLRQHRARSHFSGTREPAVSGLLDPTTRATARPSPVIAEGKLIAHAVGCATCPSYLPGGMRGWWSCQSRSAEVRDQERGSSGANCSGTGVRQTRFRRLARRMMATTRPGCLIHGRLLHLQGNEERRSPGKTRSIPHNPAARKALTPQANLRSLASSPLDRACQIG